MDKDRTAVCNIISDMLNNPGENGIYCTSTAYARLELYIEGVRAESLGWAHIRACAELDKGKDPRVTGVPEMLARARVDLSV